MKKLIPATLAVAALLTFTPAFAGETTLHAESGTPVSATSTTTTIKTDTVPVTTQVTTPATVTTPAGEVSGVATTTTTTEVPVGTTTTTTTTSTEVPTGAAKVESYVMQDGTNVIVVDKQAFVVAADGTKKPAPDGNIVTKDGVSLKVRGGVLVTDTVPGTADVNTSASGATAVVEPEHKPAEAPKE